MFKCSEFDTQKFDSILSRGLSSGLGQAGGQVCIEAAICETLGLGHSDNPKCVASSVRSFKIRLNDSTWSSPSARAKGLRDLGLAQLGSLGVVDDTQFSSTVSEKFIRVLLPTLFREVFPNNPACLVAADRCEKEGTAGAAEAAEAAAWAAEAAAKAAWAAEAAAWAAKAAWAAEAAAWAAAWAAEAAARAAAEAAAWAAEAAARAAAEAAAKAAWAADKYLNIAAQLGLETLKELNSPGVELLDGKE